MRIVCPKCGSSYMIDDDRINKRFLKLRCRKCHESIISDAENFSDKAKDKIRALRTQVPEAPTTDDMWYYAVNGRAFGPAERSKIIEVIRQYGEDAVRVRNVADGSWTEPKGFDEEEKKDEIPVFDGSMPPLHGHETHVFGGTGETVPVTTKIGTLKKRLLNKNKRKKRED